MSVHNFSLLEALVVVILVHFCSGILQPPLCDRAETYQIQIPVIISKWLVINQTVPRSRKIPICCEGYQEDSEYGSMCIPICVKACKNGGTCIKPNECQCTEGYTGSTCVVWKGPSNQRTETTLSVVFKGDNVTSTPSPQNMDLRSTAFRASGNNFGVSNNALPKQPNGLMWLAVVAFFSVFNVLSY